jgi:hypothetical protein
MVNFKLVRTTLKLRYLYQWHSMLKSNTHNFDLFKLAVWFSYNKRINQRIE